MNKRTCALCEATLWVVLTLTLWLVFVATIANHNLVVTVTLLDIFLIAVVSMLALGRAFQLLVTAFMQRDSGDE